MHSNPTDPLVAKRGTPRSPSVRVAWRWIVPAIAAVALGFGDWALALPTLCLHKLATGIPCGGCGMTRAFVAFARGEWVLGVGFHPLAPVAAILLVWWCVAEWTAGRSWSLRLPPKWLTAVTLLGFVTLHLLRLAGWWHPHAGVFPH